MSEWNGNENESSKEPIWQNCTPKWSRRAINPRGGVGLRTSFLRTITTSTEIQRSQWFFWEKIIDLWTFANWRYRSLPSITPFGFVEGKLLFFLKKKHKEERKEVNLRTKTSQYAELYHRNKLGAESVFSDSTFFEQISLRIIEVDKRYKEKGWVGKEFDNQWIVISRVPVWSLCDFLWQFLSVFEVCWCSAWNPGQVVRSRWWRGKPPVFLTKFRSKKVKKSARSWFFWTTF